MLKVMELCYIKRISYHVFVFLIVSLGNQNQLKPFGSSNIYLTGYTIFYHVTLRSRAFLFNDEVSID